MVLTFCLWRADAVGGGGGIERVTVSGTPVAWYQGSFTGVTIPIKRAGNLLLIEGTINNMTVNFILDTGSSGLVLNQTYFRGSMTIRDEEGGGVTGATSGVTRMVVKHLEISELVYNNVSADVIPLGHLENRRGVKILGLIGMSMLRDIEMVLDVNSNELQIFRLDKNGLRIAQNVTAPKFDVTQKIDEFHHMLFVRATISGKALDFCLDTGAESNVLDLEGNKKILSTLTITSRSDLGGVGQNRGEVFYGTINDFLMGTRQMAPMETIICSLASMSEKYGYPIDGMLGYDFFAKGKIYINLVKRELGICLRKEEKK